MRIDILTLFPEMFSPLQSSITGRGIKKEKIEINLINIRDFSKNKHKKVDDTPYGGGAGMLLKADVVYEAYKSIEKTDKTKTIYLSPKGEVLKHVGVEELSKNEHLILICGHYEGIDQRVIEYIGAQEISIGDYVLTGGEIPAMVLIDTISRQVEGVLNSDTLEEETFTNNLLEYPQYTRPEVFLDMKVPDVLLSGDHSKIAKWRKEESIKLTKKRRPDLLKDNI